MFFGYYEGYVVLYAFVILMFILAIRKPDLLLYTNTTLSTSGDVKSTISFRFSNPLLLFLTRNLRVIEIGGRSNPTGQVTLRRVESWKVFSILLAIGVIIYFVMRYIKYDLLLQQSITPTLVNAIYTDVFVLAIGWTFMIVLTSSAFLTEPLWLDLSVMTQIQFARIYLISKALLVLIFALPIGVALLALGCIVNAMAFLLFIPLSSITFISTIARYLPDPTSPTLSPISIIAVLVIFTPLSTIAVIPVLVKASIIPPYTIFYTIIALAIYYISISIPFLISKSYWDSTIEKIVTSNFPQR
ncbi:hypothetical protein HS5_01480 [Acidianus sp. HS-5]|nr:hypothetical protein HS5_01480 [Acidianus sp. HS-5]